jgi:hypothetical protein
MRTPEFTTFLLRVFAPSSQILLWDGFLTPEGSERVPTDLRILHDMIAVLQENKIRKREGSISTYTC